MLAKMRIILIMENTDMYSKISAGGYLMIFIFSKKTMLIMANTKPIGPTI